MNLSNCSSTTFGQSVSIENEPFRPIPIKQGLLPSFEIRSSSEVVAESIPMLPLPFISASKHRVESQHSVEGVNATMDNSDSVKLPSLQSALARIPSESTTTSEQWHPSPSTASSIGGPKSEAAYELISRCQTSTSTSAFTKYSGSGPRFTTEVTQQRELTKSSHSLSEK